VRPQWCERNDLTRKAASPTPGPNAPLWDKCGTSGRPESSARAAVEAWKAAGFPAEQLMLGLPSYGYIQRSTVDRLQNRRANHHERANLHPHTGLARRLQHAASVKGVAPVRVANGDGGTEDGQVQFSALVRQRVLVKGGKAPHGVPVFVGGGGFERLWDACSSTVRMSYFCPPISPDPNHRFAVVMRHARFAPSLFCPWLLWDVG
jgi:chitinase